MGTAAQTLAWGATGLGWAAAWVVGNRRPVGWLVSAVSAGAWLAVDVAITLWAGAVSAVVAGSIAIRNWRAAR